MTDETELAFRESDIPRVFVLNDFNAAPSSIGSLITIAYVSGLARLSTFTPLILPVPYQPP